jgi:hypothetical protein
VSDPIELGRLQEWVGNVITRPDGGTDGLEAVICSTARLGARERVALYRRSYHLRLLEVMRVTYPGLRHMLGGELFDDFALEYLGARPSRSYTLHRLGAGFAGYLAETRPDADGAPEAWTSMMVDLARLEQTFAEVYDAPGSEGHRVPAAAELALEPDLGDLEVIVEPVPCLRLAASSFPAAAYLSAVRRGADPLLPAPAASFVAVSRRDYVVTLTPLDADGYRLLAGLMQGARIGTAALAAGLDPAPAWRLVRQWADRAFLSSLVSPAPGSTPAHTAVKEPMTP